jgi:hypothetical protein
MASKDFTSLKDLMEYLNKQVQSTNKNEVAQTVVKTMQEHIQSDVYDVYDPKVYARKGYNGGLIDDSNIEAGVVDDETIYVENIRFDGDREVADIVESGQGYTYQFDYYGVPRPFTENTREELSKGTKLQQAMRDGLKKRGLDIQ